MSKSIELWCSYIGKGAPSNAAGERIGFGRTKEEASEAAGHWANQAAFAKIRKVTITDQPSLAVVSESDQRAVAAIVPSPGTEETEFLSPEKRLLAKQSWDLAHDGKCASAIIHWYGTN